MGKLSQCQELMGLGRYDTLVSYCIMDSGPVNEDAAMDDLCLRWCSAVDLHSTSSLHGKRQSLSGILNRFCALAGNAGQKTGVERPWETIPAGTMIPIDTDSGI